MKSCIKEGKEAEREIHKLMQALNHLFRVLLSFRNRSQLRFVFNNLKRQFSLFFFFFFKKQTLPALISESVRVTVFQHKVQSRTLQNMTGSLQCKS